MLGAGVLSLLALLVQKYKYPSVLRPYLPKRRAKFTTALRDVASLLHRLLFYYRRWYQNAAQAPHVHCRRVLGVTEYDLRRAVPVRDEAVSISAAALVQHSASHAEIGYFRSRPWRKMAPSALLRRYEGAMKAI